MRKWRNNRERIIVQTKVCLRHYAKAEACLRFKCLNWQQEADWVENGNSLHAIKYGTRKKLNSFFPGQKMCMFYQWTTFTGMINKLSTCFEDGNLRARAQAGNPIKRPFTDFGFTQYAWTSAAAANQFDARINRAAIHWATFSLGHPASSVYSSSLFSFHRHAKWLLFPVDDNPALTTTFVIYRISLYWW